MFNTSVEAITFPEVRSLRGKYGLTYEKVCKIMGIKSLSTLRSKLNNMGFTPEEMIKFVKYFVGMGEKDISVQSVFFDWIYSNE